MEKISGRIGKENPGAPPEGRLSGRWRRRVAGVFVLSLFSVYAFLTSAQSVRVQFHEKDLEKFPSGWQAKEEEGRAVYKVRRDDAGVFLQAVSEADSFTIGHEISVDPSRFPFFRFSWRAVSLPSGGDERRKKTNDSALGVYVIFKGWSIPPRSIKYVWSTTLAEGTFTRSPYSKKAKMVVLRSGEEKLGQWLEEEVNVYEDFKRLFGKEKVPKIKGIGLLTDSDNTGSRSAGDYLFFGFSSSE